MFGGYVGGRELRCEGMDPTGMFEARQRRSLIAFYFGGTVARDPDLSTDRAVTVVSMRAYRDVSRTIHGMGSLDGAAELRDEIHRSIVEFVERLEEVADQADFDRKHHAWCCRTIETFSNYPHRDREGFGLCYGQAQKWLNMALKYLAVLGHAGVSSVYPYLHAPLDQVVYRQARKSWDLSAPAGAWSRLEEKDYCRYQEALRAAVKEDFASVMDWEAHLWVDGVGVPH